MKHSLQRDGYKLRTRGSAVHPPAKHSIYGQYALPAILLPICDCPGSSPSLDYFCPTRYE